MKPPLYAHQLWRDLEHWLAQGLISERQRAAVVTGTGRSGPAVPMMVVVSAMLAAVLGAAMATAMVLVWQYVPPLARVVLPIVAMLVLYLLSGTMMAVGRRVGANLCLFAALLAFTLAVWTIGEVFKVSTLYADGAILFIAAVGALAAAAIIGSRFALLLALTLSAAWTATEYLNFGTQFHWGFLVFFIPASVLVGRWRWEPGVYFAFAAMLVWAWLTIFTAAGNIFNWDPLQYSSVHVLLWTTVWIVAHAMSRGTWGAGRALERTALAAMLASLFYLSLASSGNRLFDLLAEVTGLEGHDERMFGWLAWGTAVSGLSVLSLIMTMVAAIANRLRAIDVPMVMLILTFGLGYPIAYPYFEALVFELPPAAFILLDAVPAALYLVFALWVASFGAWRRDDILLSLGVLGAVIGIVQIVLAGVFGISEQARLLTIGGAGVLIFLILLEQISQGLAQQETDGEVDLDDIPPPPPVDGARDGERP